MSDARIIEAQKALARYEDRNSRPNPAHLADAIRGLIAVIEEQDEPDAEPCDAELYSWNYFKPEQVDPYYMRCHQVGLHVEHKNSETGAHWPVEAREE